MFKKKKKPVGKITFGVEVKRCSDCSKSAECETCSYKAYAKLVEDLPSCNTCALVKTCSAAPKWGEPVRINCPLYVKKPEEVNT